MGSLKGNERDFFNEFLHGTTPVPPNYLQEFIMDGGGEMLIYFIDKLIYTLEVVRTSITITDFIIDESSLGKLIDSCHSTHSLNLQNCKLSISDLLDLDDRNECKLIYFEY